LAFLSSELDRDPSLELVGGQMTELRESIHEDIASSNIQRQIPGIACSPQFLDLSLEMQPLVLEVEQVWHVLDEFTDGAYVLLCTFSFSSSCAVNVLDELVQDRAVLEAE
jgi:hypothetical protein